MNSIDICVEFSFKGESFNPSLTLDFDQLQVDGQVSLDLYQMIAKANHIDTYSYLYEVMQANEILFSHPKGLTKSFFNNGQFEFEAFIAAYQEQLLVNKLEQIAIEELGNLKLSDNKPLQRSLLRAYRLGEQEKQ